MKWTVEILLALTKPAHFHYIDEIGFDVSPTIAYLELYNHHNECVGVYLRNAEGAEQLMKEAQTLIS